MFCTACGSFVTSASIACPVCARDLPVTGISRRAVRAPLSRWRALLALLPLVLLLGIVGTGVVRWREIHREQDSVYARAEAALDAGDFDAAAMGFSALGGYRDADERLGEVRASEQPV